MPLPQSSEKLSHFVGRFMSSSEAKKSFPSQKQRAAVAYSVFKKGKKK